MSTTVDHSKQRPFSADVRLTKTRLQSSNCPTIVKHEIVNPADTFQGFSTSFATEKHPLERPWTATNSTKMKFTFLQNMRPISTPMSAVSKRPATAQMNSTINFDFLSNIGKVPNGKFQDNSKIKPLKKLNTNQFHNVMYRVKQQKEILEKDINKMEQWHRDFKENDIWSTPQSAIIESILKHNALSNPDGTISKYLQIEKEKENQLRLTRSPSRPTSSHSFLPKRALKIKSVKDFFGPDENGEEVIREILNYKKEYYNQYESNKRKITDKINTYVGKLENLHNSLQTNKYSLVAGLVDPRETTGNSVAFEEMHGKSFPEIEEDNEASDVTPSATHIYQKLPKTLIQSSSQGKARPVSAQMQIQTAFGAKDFSNIQQNGPVSGKPSAIHSRPQTAKHVLRGQPMTTIANGLAVQGEQKQQSVGNVKFLPMCLEGNSIQAEQYNQNKTPSKGLNLKEKGIQTTDLEMRGSKSGFQLKSVPRKVLGIIEQEANEEPAGVERRLMSAKASMRSTGRILFKSQNEQGDGSSKMGKVNIDGQYFDAFPDKKPTKTFFGIVSH